MSPSDLIKANINILDYHDDKVFFEFQWRTKSGTAKWSKAFWWVPQGDDPYAVAYEKAQTIRSELEN